MRRAPLTLAAAVLALTLGAAVLAAGASAKGSLVGTCLSDLELPCSASDGQTYGSTTLPDGNDSEASIEAVLGQIEAEPTDITAVATDLHADGEGFDFTNPDSPGDESFSWEYSGTAPLAYLAVTSDRGGFALYDVFGKTHGTIDVEPLLGSGWEHVDHFSFWQRTFSECDPVKVVGDHGKGLLPGCQLAEIQKGKVLCVNIKTTKVKHCAFKTGKKPNRGQRAGPKSGSWLEGIKNGRHAKYALANQAVSRKGKKHGAWVVASKTVKTGELPCRKVPASKRRAEKVTQGEKRDTASYTSDGSLAGMGYNEVNTARTNVSGNPLQNYATRIVWTTDSTHPDGATLVTHDPGTTTYGYSFTGAGMNDMYGVERYSPAAGSVYIDDPYHRHFITYNAATVGAAKRPNTKPNGQVLPSSIAWRTINPNANIAN